MKIGERCWHCLRKAIQGHKKARLDFARTHKDWTAEQWSQTIFSDESRFRLHRSDGRVYVRRMAGEEFMEDCVQPTVKHGGGGIMVWGCINAKGVGFLTKVEGRLNGEGYINILKNVLISTTHLLTITSGWIFQQDNATCHTSKLVREWFNENGKSQSWIGLHSQLISIQSNFGTRLRQWSGNKIQQVLKNFGLQ